MSEAKKIRVLRALGRFAEGGSMLAAREAENLGGSDFYSVLRDYPEVEAQYRFVQQCRADMHVEEARDIMNKVLSGELDPKSARVVLDGYVKIAGLHDRQRYGEHIQIDQTVNGRIDLVAARTRALISRPNCDLANAIDTEVIDNAALPAPRATDTKSVTDAPAPGTVDIFEC